MTYTDDGRPPIGPAVKVDRRVNLATTLATGDNPMTTPDLPEQFDRIHRRLDDLVDAIDGLVERIDGFRAEVELRFADVSDQINTINRTVGTAAAVLAQHLQDHQHGDAA